jgi:hypothetical protein
MDVRGYGYRKEPLSKRLRGSITESRRGRSRSAYMREEGGFVLVILWGVWCYEVRFPAFLFRGMDRR